MERLREPLRRRQRAVVSGRAEGVGGVGPQGGGAGAGVGPHELRRVKGRRVKLRRVARRC